MFGLDFLFLTALWALPLAALPLVLHLLYRRKSPVVLFPTLRFIKSSLQQTAARRKVQKWLLLAVRMLLLALLIWAVAQPAKMLASRFFASGGSSAAVIVVDTSWSMEYRQNQVALLTDADGIVQELLRGELRDGSVMILTSGAAARGRQFRSSAELLAQWTPLKPQGATVPLVERVQEAIEALKEQPPTQKLLIIISDFQTREFPQGLTEMADKDLRIVALDLHPERPRSAGVTKIALEPAEAMAGIRGSAEVTVAGAAGDVRPVLLRVKSLDGKELLARPPVMATLDSTGHAQSRFDLELPGERWQLVEAKLQGDDPMPWDDSRVMALEIPTQQRVTVLEAAGVLAQPGRIVKLALDPNDGKLDAWPLKVKVAAVLAGDESAAVALLDKLPDVQTLARWNEYVGQGGTLVVMLRPGFEDAFAAAGELAKREMEKLLPSRPVVEAGVEDRVYHGMPTGAGRVESSTKGLADDAKNLATLQVRRVVPMTVADSVKTQVLIGLAAGDRAAPVDRNAMLYLKRVGSGRVFVWACVPEGFNTNLGTHSLFLPLLVNQCMRASSASGAKNQEIGGALVWDDPKLAEEKEMDLRTPGDVAFRVPGSVRDGRRVFAFDKAGEPGIYRWYRVGDHAVRGVTNVTLPAEESEMSYRPAEGVLPQDERTLVARSLAEMQGKVARISQPQPKWSMPIAIALMLLCTEGLLSTESRIWAWFKRK